MKQLIAGLLCLIAVAVFTGCATSTQMRTSHAADEGVEQEAKATGWTLGIVQEND